MKYREMISKVQSYSGFSDKESEGALKTFVKALSKRMKESDRKTFASQLPSELEQIALTTGTTASTTADDFYIEMADEQHIDKVTAKKQIIASWQVLKEALSPSQILNIKHMMPKELAIQLQ